MTLKDKLNIKQATKTTSKKSSLESDLHQLVCSAIDTALRNSKEHSKYYKPNLTIDTFVQDDNNKVKLVEVRNANCITIPIDNVELKNDEQTHTIDKAIKVGEIQVYFKGIKKQVAEFIPTPKNNK